MSEQARQSSSAGHRVVLTFEDGFGPHAKLLCPDGGCSTANSCAHCGRDLHDEESKPCYDCTDAEKWRDECWIKTWFDNLTPDELLSGEVTVEVEAEWDFDHPVVTITGVVPKAEAT